MSVIDIDLAMKHLLAEPEDQVLIEVQLDAAEEAAAQFIQRRFFLDQDALNDAKANISSRLADARAVYDSAKALADDAQHSIDCRRLGDQARQAYADALEGIDKDAYGIVINKAIVAACLLKLGHLFANREEVITGTIATELPLASQSLLMPYRIRMGV